MTKHVNYILSEKAKELFKYPNANHLLNVIAHTCKKDNSRKTPLSMGECVISGSGSVGLTEREYRTAKKKLSDMGLAYFRGTNKGTIATIANNSVYNIRNESTGKKTDKHDQIDIFKSCPYSVEGELEDNQKDDQ